jgi:hypothetical protein
VIGTQGLGDSYHDALMAVIESDNGQQSNELAEMLSVRKFPDGSNMLGYLHGRGHLKKVPTNLVLMTPDSQTSILLAELNELIAEQKGISIEELAVSDGKPVVKSPVKKRPADPEIETPEMTAAKLRSQADAMFKEAKELRAQAESLVPTVKKKKVTVEE